MCSAAVLKGAAQHNHAIALALITLIPRHHLCRREECHGVNNSLVVRRSFPEMASKLNILAPRLPEPVGWECEVIGLKDLSSNQVYSCLFTYYISSVQPPTKYCTDAYRGDA